MPFFGKKGTILVPLGHQNEVAPPDKRALFSKSVPHGHHFIQNGALSIKRALFWCHWGTNFPRKKVAQGAPKQCHFAKRHRFQPFFFGKWCHFSRKDNILVPFWHCLCIEKLMYGKTLPFRKVAPKHCPKRYHFTDNQTVPKGHHFGATYFFECQTRLDQSRLE